MAVRKVYSIAVVAPVSAGKSTLLNAMMGRSLLPSKSTACTAGVFSVVDDDHAIEFRVRGRKSKSRYTTWRRANPDVLASMNASGFPRVEIEGDLKRISNFRGRFKVAFIDTPGPNNACDLTHAQILQGVLETSAFSSIVVVLNAASLHTTDEAALISEIRQYLKSHRRSIDVIFVLNRIDALFHGRECNKSLVEIVNGTKKYLTERFEFEHPVVIPTWASLALECRQLLDDPTYVKTLDEDDEAGISLAIKKIKNHREEIESAAKADDFKAQASDRDLSESGKIILSRTGNCLAVSDLVLAERLTGVPLVEHWAERQLERSINAGRRRKAQKCFKTKSKNAKSEGHLKRTQAIKHSRGEKNRSRK